MIKRIFDIIFSLTGLLIISPVILFLTLISGVDTKSTGIFTQTRVGRHGKFFTIYKIRSLSKNFNISKFGAFLRRSKMDELPQFLNILLGDMSFVGPRPDIPGYYDLLTGENRLILNLRPGLTSAASIKYKNEEELLSGQKDSLKYNDEVIFPDKVKLNLRYYYTHSISLDLQIIWKTIIS